MNRIAHFLDKDDHPPRLYTAAEVERYIKYVVDETNRLWMERLDETERNLFHVVDMERTHANYSPD
jgi:hypothetical protein